MGLENFSLERKNAVVTGASRWIGEEIALTYADAGADLALEARSADELERVAERVRSLGRRAVGLDRRRWTTNRRFRPYLDAVQGCFGAEIDYGSDPDGEKAIPSCIGAESHDIPVGS